MSRRDTRQAQTETGSFVVVVHEKVCDVFGAQMLQTISIEYTFQSDKSISTQRGNWEEIHRHNLVLFLNFESYSCLRLG